MRQRVLARNKIGIRRLTIIALAVLAISLGTTAAGVSAAGDGDEVPSIPEKRELKYPNLGSRLNDMAVKAEEGQASAQEAADGATVRGEWSVAVTIYLSGNVSDVSGFLEDNGGDPRNVGEDYIEAYVPVMLLGEVSEQPGVIRVREITTPHGALGYFRSQGVQSHLSAAWNRAGYRGRGVKVGVIDIGFKGFSELMGIELPLRVRARCYTDVGRFSGNTADCEISRSGSDHDHGTLVAETVMDIAPEVDLYIANPASKGDAIEVVDWMVAESVSVIVQSLSWAFDGPGDGTSPFRYSPLNAVDRAVNGGVTWVNSAGNDAERTWFGSYSDADRDGWIEFDLIDESVSLQLEAEDRIRIQLRWEDAWGGASSNFDLYLYSLDPAPIIVKAAVDPQSGGPGHIPWEYLEYVVPWDGEYHVAVWHRGGGVPGWLQVMVWGDVYSIQHYTQSGSIANPAESVNRGMLAVGAAPWYNVHAIEPYSSRGPTPDGRVKPDVVGATCGETSQRPLYEGRGFCGTSQAAPHVAGLAALVRQRFPNYTPAQVVSYLKDNAAQREAPDPNNTWGHGFAVLPDIQEICATFAPGLRFDCDTLLAVRDALSGSASLNWSPHRSIADWEGVTVAGSPPRVTELTLPGKVLTGQIPPELGDLANLARLRLQNNELTGEIPSGLGDLANLEELILWDNQLSGEIPAKLGDLANLTGLWLSNNRLTGEIPAELGDLASLTGLWLSNNRLTGEIPAELGDLASLTGLWLSNNRLTGEIPAELDRLSNLTVLSLSHNQLSGCVPAGLRDVAFNDFEELGLLFCESPQTLLGRYDADNNGTIEKSEMIAAINDYLFGVGDNAISKADMIEVTNLYLFG